MSFELLAGNPGKFKHHEPAGVNNGHNCPQSIKQPTNQEAGATKKSNSWTMDEVWQQKNLT